MNQINSIPYTADREPVLLPVAVAAHVLTVVAHVPVPSERRIDLGTTPPAAVVAHSKRNHCSRYGSRPEGPRIRNYHGRCRRYSTRW